MDYKKLRDLNSSARVAENYSLDELVTGAREYKAASDELEERRASLQKEANRIEAELAKVSREMNDISFGGLLLNAIGIKTMNASENS